MTRWSRVGNKDLIQPGYISILLFVYLKTDSHKNILMFEDQYAWPKLIS